MTCISMASLAYVATQVGPATTPFIMVLIVGQLLFALSSSLVCRTDTTTDSERFYNTVLDFLDNPDKKPNVNELLDWWNWSVHI